MPQNVTHTWKIVVQHLIHLDIDYNPSLDIFYLIISDSDSDTLQLPHSRDHFSPHHPPSYFSPNRLRHRVPPAISYLIPSGFQVLYTYHCLKPETGQGKMLCASFLSPSQGPTGACAGRRTSSLLSTSSESALWSVPNKSTSFKFLFEHSWRTQLVWG